MIKQRPLDRTKHRHLDMIKQRPLDRTKQRHLDKIKQETFRHD